VQRRNSILNAYYFGLLLLGLLLSVWSRRLEPLCVVLPLVIVLAYSRLVRTQPVLHVQCAVTPVRAFEGDCLSVRISLKADTAVPPMELWHLLPSEAVCVAGSARVLLTLRPGEERLLEHQVTFTRRGVYTLGRLYSRLHTGAGLQPLLAEYRHDQECRIYPRVAPLRRSLPPWRTHISFGHYVSRAAGEGIEFAGIRPYNSGDRIRRIHWPTSLKRQQLYVTEYAPEYNADVIILLDTLVAVGNPREATTLDIAVRAAASLTSYYLSQKDRVGFVSYGGVCTWVLPSSGQQQWHRILEALLTTRTHFSYLTKDITLIPPRVLPPGALIYVLTTLLDPRIEAVLHDLAARSFQLVLVVISPAHAMQSAHPRAEASERLWRLEMGLRLHPFRRLGVPIVLQEAEDPLLYLHPSLARDTAWRRAR
jgi:uncharacterized protein (DUF58 family)